MQPAAAGERVGAGGGFWKYPHSGGARRQALINAWTLSVRPGAGIRLFFLPDLGIGLDLNFQIGFQVDRFQAMGQAAADTQARFMAGLEVLPLIIEYRF